MAEMRGAAAAPAPAKVPEQQRPHSTKFVRAVLGFGRSFAGNVPYLYFLRFPIALWVLLPAFILADDGGVAASMLHGLMTLGRRWQFFYCGAAAFLTCAVALGTARLVFSYGKERFGLEPPRLSLAKKLSWMHVFLAQLPALWFIYHLASQSEDVSKRAGMVSGLMGWTAGFLVIAVVTLLYCWLRGTDKDVTRHEIFLPVTSNRYDPFAYVLRSQEPPFDTTVNLPRWVARVLGAGYMRQPPHNSRTVHAGHILALCCLLALLAIYVVIGVVAAPSGDTTTDPAFPTIAAVLFIAIFLTWVLRALAFFFDRFRVPVLLLIVLAGFASGELFGSAEHYYRVFAAGEDVAWPTPREVVDEWESRHPDRTTPLVVIAAEGGGIQASAWTAKVLEQLDGISDKRLRDSVVLISSVSGGSVAAMDFANSFIQMPPDSNCLSKMARASSLEAVAWGLLYPDLQRTVFGPLSPLKYRDRGDALQRRWKMLRANSGCTPMKMGERLSLNDWAKRLQDKRMPAVALNATSTETGQRFLLGNFDLHRRFGPHRDTNCHAGKIVNDDQDWTINFHEVFPGCDIDVTTAARLSATFTYVTPQARADLISTGSDIAHPEKIHIADGGYYDNYGVATAADFLSAAITPLPRNGATPKQAARPLLFIEILCCELPTATGVVEDAKLAYDHGAWYQVWAPLNTLTSVRTAGQWEHSREVLRLLAGNLGGQYDMQVAVLPFLRPAKCMEDHKPVPLSWHLTKREQLEIDKQWNKLAEGDDSGALCPVMKAFGTLPKDSECPAP